jgi:hypothetical protein
VALLRGGGRGALGVFAPQRMRIFEAQSSVCVWCALWLGLSSWHERKGRRVRCVTDARCGLGTAAGPRGRAQGSVRWWCALGLGTAAGRWGQGAGFCTLLVRTGAVAQQLAQVVGAQRGAYVVGALGLNFGGGGGGRAWVQVASRALQYGGSKWLLWLLW